VAGPWDAELKLLYAVDDGAFFAIDSLSKGAPFDVIANVEIGDQVMRSVDKFDLWTFVRNLSKSTTMANNLKTEALPDQTTPLNREIRVDFSALGAGAAEGDIAEVVAAFKVTSGVNTFFSLQRSNLFLISA
jgi:hypothetical protein